MVWRVKAVKVGKVRKGRAVCGMVGHGTAVEAGHGRAGLGKAGLGKAGQSRQGAIKKKEVKKNGCI